MTQDFILGFLLGIIAGAIILSWFIDPRGLR